MSGYISTNSGTKEKTNNKLNQNMTPIPGFEHWWKGSALKTAPALLTMNVRRPFLRKEENPGLKRLFYIHFVRGNLHNHFIHGSCIHGKAPVRIERFRSRDQHLCKFIGTEEGFNIRKRFDSTQDRSGTPRWSTFYCFMVANVYARSAHCVCDKFRNL